MVAFETSTHSSVIDNSALGIKSTRSRTWIGTLHVDTGLCRRTLGVQDTLGLATNVGIANVVFIHAVTDRSTIKESADSIGTTW